jgi:sortase B
MPDKETEGKSGKLRIISYVLGATGIVAAFFLARLLSGAYVYPETAAAMSESESLAATVVVEESPMVAPLSEEELNDLYSSAKQEVTEEGKEDEEEVAYVSPIDFASLQAVNEDVYAWITVAGTEIDYPLLQHPTDNSRYLNYKIDGSYGLPGCIYTENMNARDFSDNNTVIYGHNMKDGTMFAGLHAFEKSEFFDNNREIIIYLPDRELRYQIFAAYIYDDRHLLYSFNFADPRVYADYLKAIYEQGGANANIDKDMTVTADDRIVTLATCIANQGDKRLLVQAVLTNPEVMGQSE